MKKKIIAAVVLAAPVGFAGIGVAQAGNPDAGCGLGTMIWESNGNLNNWATKTLAVTTNGTSGNQTFGITTGTLGCSKEGALLGNARLTEFASANMDHLAADMARGTGESLDTLAALYNVSESDRAAFNAALKQNYERIYSSTELTAEELLINVNNTIAATESLSQYALSS